MPFTSKAKESRELVCKLNLRRELAFSGKSKPEVIETLLTLANELKTDLINLYKGEYSTYSLSKQEKFDDKIKKLPIGRYVFEFMQRDSSLYEVTRSTYKYNVKTASADLPKQCIRHDQPDFEYPANKSRAEAAVMAQFELLEITKKVLISAQLESTPAVESKEESVSKQKFRM